MIGHFKEENESKYLVLDDADENKEVNGDKKSWIWQRLLKN